MAYLTGKFMMLISKLFKDETGASAVEYALLVAMVGIFCIGALGYLGDEISDTFVQAADELDAQQNVTVTK
jgi:pilus assembly protein Flp/PilA